MLVSWIKFQNFASRLGGLGVSLLLACSSATGPSGLGGDSSVGGGNIASGVGGGVGGGEGGTANAAAGTVNLPAPASIGMVPTEDLLVFKIVCRNIRGPQVECYGAEDSAPANSQLRLTVHPPGNLGTINIGIPVMVTVNANGSWDGFVTASAGQMIQICLMKAGLCKESLFITVGPEGSEVNGVQGIKKNLVIDSHGNMFYTRREIAPAKKSWSWTALFISEANASEPTVFTGPLNPGALRITPEMPHVELRMTLPSYALKAAECPSQPAVVSPVVDDAGSSIEGNRATIWQQNRFAELPFPTKIAWIPNASRFDIRALASLPFTKAGGSGTDDYLAAAVKNFVYMIRYTGESSTLETRYDFPDQFEVSQLVEVPPFIYVLLSPKAGGAKPTYPVYRIYKKIDYSTYTYSGEMVAECAPVSEALANLKSIEEIDVWCPPTEACKTNIAGIGMTDEGKYRLFVGAPEIRADLSDFPPVILKEYDHPVEIRILGMDATGVSMVVLDPTNKTLTTVSYNWASAPETAVFQEMSLATWGLNYPRLLTVDASSKNLAFLDIQERSSKIFSFSFDGHGHDFSIRRIPVTYDLGLSAPNNLRRVDDKWAYNDGAGAIRKVESSLEGALTLPADEIRSDYTTPRGPGGRPIEFPPLR